MEGHIPNSFDDLQELVTQLVLGNAGSLGGEITIVKRADAPREFRRRDRRVEMEMTAAGEVVVLLFEGKDEAPTVRISGVTQSPGDLAQRVIAALQGQIPTE